MLKKGGVQLKKSLLFVGIFAVAFIVVQFLTGILLTIFYKPSVSTSGKAISNLSSQVEFGDVHTVPSLVIALLALGIAYGVTKRFGKKTAH